MFAPVSEVMMTRNLTSMKIWAVSGTKEAAKQVLTFFFEEHPLCERNLRQITPGMAMSPKKWSTAVLLPLSVPPGLCLVTHNSFVLKRPAF